MSSGTPPRGDDSIFASGASGSGDRMSVGRPRRSPRQCALVVWPLAVVLLVGLTGCALIDALRGLPDVLATGDPDERKPVVGREDNEAGGPALAPPASCR